MKKIVFDSTVQQEETQFRCREDLCVGLCENRNELGECIACAWIVKPTQLVWVSVGLCSSMTFWPQKNLLQRHGIHLSEDLQAQLSFNLAHNGTADPCSLDRSMVHASEQHGDGSTSGVCVSCAMLTPRCQLACTVQYSAILLAVSVKGASHPDDHANARDFTCSFSNEKKQNKRKRKRVQRSRHVCLFHRPKPVNIASPKKKKLIKKEWHRKRVSTKDCGNYTVTVLYSTALYRRNWSDAAVPVLMEKGRFRSRGCRH